MIKNPNCKCNCSYLQNNLVRVTSMIVSSNLSANLSQRNSSTSSRLNSLSKCLFFHELYRWIIDSLIFEGSFSTEIPLLNLSTIFEAISALSVFTDNIGLFAAMYSQVFPGT